MKPTKAVTLAALLGALAWAGCQGAEDSSETGTSSATGSLGEDGKGSAGNAVNDPVTQDPNQPPVDPGCGGGGGGTQVCESGVLGGPTSCKTDVAWKTAVSDFCASKKLQATELYPFDSCGTNSFRQAKYVCCSAAPPPPPPPVCVGFALGGPTSCKTSSDWKSAGANACSAQKLTLTNLSTFDSCGPDSYRQAKVTCCEIAPPPPPPPPPPPVCVGLALGGPTSCKTTADWKAAASNACAAQKLDLSQLSTFDACGADSYRQAKVLCCAPNPQPPPPGPVCEARAGGSATSCKSEADWKTAAAADCGAAKLTLGQIYFADACSGGFRYTKYECCK